MRIPEPFPENLIIWAVDPFQMETKPDPITLQEFQRWAKVTNSQIQPVHVLTVPKSDYAKDQKDSLALRYIPVTEQTTLQFLKDLGISLDDKNTLPPKVLIETSSSTKRMALQLLDFAKEVKAKMIVVSSKGRSGMERIIMGSFAESLISESGIPILFLTHSKEVKRESINKVVFPTDFSDNSKRAFDLFILEAKAMGSELILFHEVTFPILTTSGLSAGGIAWVPDNYLKEQVAWANQEGSRWIQKAQDQGVSARWIVREDSQNVPKSILELARKENAGLIAMASQSGAFAAALVGSVAREIFRSNRYPVWVCGPKMMP